VLRAGELSGFKIGLGGPRIVFDSAALAKLLAEPGEAGKLNRAGFKSGVFEFLKNSDGIFAYSIAYEYGSPQEARADLNRILRKDRETPDARATGLGVHDIPGARGLRITFNDGTPQFEVFFADGRFLYEQTTLGRPKGPTLKPEPLIQASRKLYTRVRGTGGQTGPGTS
jgi:hypothetical protein